MSRFLFRLSTRTVNQQWLSHRCFASQTDFEAAQKRLASVNTSVDNATKLRIYGLFKQATVGKVNIKRPGLMDPVGRAKWDAWNEVAPLAPEEARQRYVAIVDELSGGSEATTSEAGPTTEAGGDLIVTQSNGVKTIRINRPKRFNAISNKIYTGLPKLLHEAGKDPEVKCVVLTGTGAYYSSGNDLQEFGNIDMNNIPKFAKDAGEMLEKFVNGFIDFPKPLIAVVNGPAIGIMATTLGLCDAVFASDAATFLTPFSRVAQTPEGCSSYLFPKIMGRLANDMLMFDKQINAFEAKSAGLVTEVFPASTFEVEVDARVHRISKLPRETLIHTKALMKSHGELETLHLVNRAECDLLVQRWQSEEFFQAIAAFMTRKNK